jgi:hypothetical protein
MRVLAALAGVGVLVAGCAGAMPTASVEGVRSSLPTASAQASLTAPPWSPKQFADQIVAGHPGGTVVAAAYVTTTYSDYAASLPDMAGLPSAPASSNDVVIVEVAGWFPGSCSFYTVRSCPFTSIIVRYDRTLGIEIERTFAFDPRSPDIPGSMASPDERFSDLARRFGTPNLLAIAPGS